MLSYIALVVSAITFGYVHWKSRRLTRFNAEFRRAVAENAAMRQSFENIGFAVTLDWKNNNELRVGLTTGNVDVAELLARRYNLPLTQMAPSSERPQ